MMQPCASAAKLRGGGPILRSGFEARGNSGHRHLGSSLEADDNPVVRLRNLFCFLSSRRT
jgi:hypothetical protein